MQLLLQLLGSYDANRVLAISPLGEVLFGPLGDLLHTHQQVGELIGRTDFDLAQSIFRHAPIKVCTRICADEVCLSSLSAYVVGRPFFGQLPAEDVQRREYPLHNLIPVGFALCNLQSLHVVRACFHAVHCSGTRGAGVTPTGDLQILPTPILE